MLFTSVVVKEAESNFNFFTLSECFLSQKAAEINPVESAYQCNLI